MTYAIRIGSGFDTHALVHGRKLVLGGVAIPFDRGLDGHSDADVLLHSICDAIIGALAQGDIGGHFPDTDAQYRDADSRGLLRAVWQRAIEAGYALGNVDATIIAQAPKLAPYVGRMVAHIASDLASDVDQVNIKAKTTEHLGFTGRGEGIAAFATVLLIKLPVAAAT
jgi:2-C-methyl-D-erythritol 2,4-cyclodiphosphate synthase